MKIVYLGQFVEKCYSLFKLGVQYLEGVSSKKWPFAKVLMAFNIIMMSCIE